MVPLDKARQSGYDRSGDRYAARRYGNANNDRYRKMRNEVLLKIIEERFGSERPLKILEVGCGPGLTLEFLAGLNPTHELHGIDFSRTMLVDAEQRLSQSPNKPRFQYANAFETPFDSGTFHVVLSTRFIHQFAHDEKKRLHNEMLRLTKQGGIVVCEFYARTHHMVRGALGSAKARHYYRSHCPSTREVREIVGGRFRRRPVLMVGARFVSALGGARGVRLATSLTSRMPMAALIDTYFVATEKQTEPN